MLACGLNIILICYILKIGRVELAMDRILAAKVTKKIVVVGNVRSGKTCLIERFINNTFYY